MPVQLSMLPDEIPDEFISSKKLKRRSITATLRRLINKEGFYNYAKVAEEALSKSEDYIQAKFGLTKDELKTAFESEFGHACCYQESIESFLEKLRTIPDFKLENYNGI